MKDRRVLLARYRLKCRELGVSWLTKDPREWTVPELVAELERLGAMPAPRVRVTFR